MPDTIKSALFVDYDSLYRSLKSAGKEAAERLAQRAAAWVSAIETGRLVRGRALRRRVLIRRCYADPLLLGKNRVAFIAGGFEVIDCPPLEGRERNSSAIHMVLDTMDALEHPTGYDEFIMLAADTDLTPVLHRVRAHNRTTVIYASAATPASYRSSADAVIEETPLLQLLSAGEPREVREIAPPPEATAEAAPRQALAPISDRADIEVLARKVHNATSVPLFSPRTFADLFRILAQEIAENGYHFQNTADNVAAKLTAAGRSVTRRQVVFVVKGLALKGHVFSTTDSAERLAEVFREQVLYLIRNAGLELEPREEGLLPTWIVGRVSPAVAAAEPETPKPTVDDKATRRKLAKPAAPVPQPQPARAAAPVPAAASSVPPAAPRPPVAPPTRSIEDIKAAAAARLAGMKASSPPPPASAPAKAPPPAPTAKAPPPAAAKPAPAPLARPTPAPPQRTAASPRPTPSRPAAPPPSRPAPSSEPVIPRAAPVAPQPRPAAAGARTTPQPAAKEALEDSILAAIAQAVDVLVEDGTTTSPAGAEPATSPALTTPAAPVDPAPSEGGESDDIGDEIQRIIASYSRARQQGEKR